VLVLYTKHCHDDVIRDEMGVHIDRMGSNVYKMLFLEKVKEIEHLEGLGVAWSIVLTLILLMWRIG
jgi:hypothetical protein